jgi:hypothetical protein
MSDKKHKKTLKRRDKKKKDKANMDQAEKKVAKAVAAFSNLPTKCTTCEASFDSKSREDHMTWKVAVRGANVRLFCVECQEKAREAAGVSNEV